MRMAMHASCGEVEADRLYSSSSMPPSCLHLPTCLPMHSICAVLPAGNANPPCQSHHFYPYIFPLVYFTTSSSRSPISLLGPYLPASLAPDPLSDQSRIYLAGFSFLLNHFTSVFFCPGRAQWRIRGAVQTHHGSSRVSPTASPTDPVLPTIRHAPLSPLALSPSSLHPISTSKTT